MEVKKEPMPTFSETILHQRPKTAEVANIDQSKSTEPKYIAAIKCENREPLKCNIFKRSYKRLSSFHKHRLIHISMNERRFKCDVCEKTFKRSDILKGHLRIHTGEKPFECGKCEKRFRFYTSLKYHRNKCHHWTGLSFDF